MSHDSRYEKECPKHGWYFDEEGCDGCEREAPVSAPDVSPPETERRCTACSEVKPLGEFYRHASSRGGRNSRCKPCINAENNRWDVANRDRVRGWARDRARRRRREHPEVIARAHALEKGTIKDRARRQLIQAVRTGRVTKPESCEGCGRKLAKRHLHGHHDDYSKPLTVKWVCAVCHTAIHRRPHVGSR